MDKPATTTDAPLGSAQAPTCPRCRLGVSEEARFCDHCGYTLTARKPVPWWHLHRRVYDWTLAWAYRPSAAVALFVLSFAESSFFPVPPDVLLMPLALGNRRKWLRYATICTVASVAGAVAGYLIGALLWGWAQSWFFRIPGITHAGYDEVARLYNQWDFWVVFTAGFTPIPFKLITITAGVVRINPAVFVIAAIVSRGARFFLVAGLMGLFGARIAPLIEKYFNWLALLFTALLIGGFALIKLVH